MRELERVIKARFFKYSELDLQARILVEMARDVRHKAQMPYSKFCVGAAVASSTFIAHIGCNVERCSFTQSTHAEQNALDTMIARHGAGTKVLAVAIIAAPAGADIVLDDAIDDAKAVSDIADVPMPCGHCLQCIWEQCHGDPAVRLISRCANGEFAEATIGDALPMRFGPLTLGVDYASGA